MSTTSHDRGGDARSLTEQHPALMGIAVLLTLVLVGGVLGPAVGRFLVLCVQLLPSLVGQGA